MVKREFKRSTVTDKYHVGFVLYDLQSGETIYAQNEHKYFTPASNTKLVTFYAGLKMLPEKVAALRYAEHGDSLIFWGTGDPSMLHTNLNSDTAIRFLQASGKKLFYAPGRYTGHFYGSGWQWDDYNDYYQPEINDLPIMENMLTARKNGEEIVFFPAVKELPIVADTNRKGDYRVIRDYDTNIFRYPVNPKTQAPAGYRQQIPYKLSVKTTLSVLSLVTNRPVDSVKRPLPAGARTLWGTPRDSVLKEMMLPSDNFVAEHLLLLCADQLGAELNTSKTIAYVQQKYLTGLPDKLVWVDGSGLSRYNLFTPASVVKLLDMIYKEFKDPAKLYEMLPAGGKTGTLKNAYPKTDQPFVFGKTGTVSNNHNQSGYVLTKKGKTYAYSFMNNNFVQPTAEIRKEMARIVTLIHEKF